MIQRLLDDAKAGMLALFLLCSALFLAACYIGYCGAVFLVKMAKLLVHAVKLFRDKLR